MERAWKRPRVKLGSGYRAGALDLARLKAIRGARRLRRRRYNYPSLKAEAKFYDTYLAATVIPSGTSFASCEMDPSASSMISTPDVGDNERQRDGKKIIITQVEIKGVINQPTASGQSSLPDGNGIWVALVLDTQTNGVQLNSEDVFKAIASTAAEIRPFRNLLFGGRFRIIKMRHFINNNRSTGNDAATTFDISGVRKHFTMFKKMRLPVNFNAGTTADVANVIDNSLHVIAFQSGGALNSATLAYQARIRFIG